MSILRRYSKRTVKEPRTQPVATRLTESEYKVFHTLCESTGYTVSEALRLLIQKEVEKELGINDTDVTTNSKHIVNGSVRDDDITKINSKHLSSNSDKEKTKVNKSKQIVKNSNQMTSKPVRKRNSSRFVTLDWNVEGNLPCPKCGAWVSATNFARHSKQHGKTTEEIFTEYKDKADEMVKLKKAEIGINNKGFTS